MEASYGVRGRDQGQQGQQPHRSPGLVARIGEQARPRELQVADASGQPGGQVGHAGPVVVLEQGRVAAQVRLVLGQQPQGVEIGVRHPARLGARIGPGFTSAPVLPVR